VSAVTGRITALEHENDFHYYDQEMEGRAPLAEMESRYRMTRCECAEVSFEEMARRMREAELSFEQACEMTGCGRTCTACLPDLRSHVYRAR
jgi:bacterioferritin-associated ferredoxin